MTRASHREREWMRSSLRPEHATSGDVAAAVEATSEGADAAACFTTRCRRRPAVRQAERMDLELRAAEGEAAVPGAQGGSHGEPRSTGEWPAATLSGRGYEGIDLSARRGQALPRDW